MSEPDRGLPTANANLASRHGAHKMRLGARSARNLAGALCILSAVCGCAGLAPRPVHEVGFLERAVTQVDGGLTVTVAVPTISESFELYGVYLAAKQIQPIWLQVRNDEQVPYFFLPSGLDPEYYTPGEVAYAFRSPFSKRPSDSLASRFYGLQFKDPVRPGETVSGFVLVNLDEGIKLVDVDLVGRDTFKSFTFLVPDPDFRGDDKTVDFASIYRQQEVVDYPTLTDLRLALEALPCCTSNKKGSAEGDPLNLVFIGDSDDIFGALVRRGWHPTEQTWSGAVWRTVKSFLAGTRYRYSPVSSLYFFGRKQDLAGQKARATIHERNHFRLWLAPMRFRGKDVWVGQISRDIGVRFTTKSPTLTTHKIDPDVDEARSYLIQDLAYSQALARLSFVPGVGKASQGEPRHNLTGDPYYTDGLRAVMEFEPRPRTLAEIDFFGGWQAPESTEVAPIREGLTDGD